MANHSILQLLNYVVILAKRGHVAARGGSVPLPRLPEAFGKQGGRRAHALGPHEAPAQAPGGDYLLQVWLQGTLRQQVPQGPPRLPVPQPKQQHPETTAIIFMFILS